MNRAEHLFSQLKSTVRQGWVQHGIIQPESVAEHSWGTALLCLCYAASAGVDAFRAASMAIAHDLAESVTGDIPWSADADRREKHGIERRAAESVVGDLSVFGVEATDLLELSLEYMEASSAEALFVRDMNLLDMVIQARRYEAVGSGRDLADFYRNSEARLNTTFGKALFRRFFGSVPEDNGDETCC
ncbi:MAG: HD domain-containing protein [Spirochaetota bacterium]